MKVLVIAEHTNAQIREHTFELISAAAELGDRVMVAIISDKPDVLVEQVNVKGVDEVVKVAINSGGFESDTWQHAVESLIISREPDIVLFGFTVNAMACAPAVAVKMEMGFCSDIISVSREEDGIVAERSLYGEKVVAQYDFTGFKNVILMLRAGVWPPEGGRGEAELSEASPGSPGSRTRHIEIKEPPPDNVVDIGKADFILCVGRGANNRQGVTQFEQLAEKMGATLAASRPVVDAGSVPRSLQVGQSGKTVKPKVYLSFGVSGAIQHTTGIKNSQTIIAVNKDPEASIFNIADYGITADLYEVAEELEKLF